MVFPSDTSNSTRLMLYAVEVYGNTCLTYIDKLCKLNNKLLRIL